MKKLIAITSLALLTISISAQSLLEIYQKGTVKLIPDKEYAQGNDWDKIFESYYDTIKTSFNRNVPIGERKSIVMKPDGSLIVNHAYKNYYSLFDANGKFVKEFGIMKNGKRIEKTNGIEGVINNNFFTELDNMGNMICMDFDGNYVKTLKLDYMAHDMIPLKNNKFAVVGWVIWKDKFRDFVSIVDYNTNKEKIIWDHFSENKTTETTPMKTITPAYMHEYMKFNQFDISIIDPREISHPKIATINDKLIIAFPKTGEFLIYDMDGNLKSKEKVEWKQNIVSVEELREIKQKGIDKYREAELCKNPKISEEEMKEAKKAVLEKAEERVNKMENDMKLPFFSTIIKDFDNNLLFFEFPKEKGANKFNVWIYKDGGNFVCQSSFVCDDYDLSIMPSKMVFRNGYIYSLQTLKNTDGNPLRLVRFKITNE